MAIRLPRSSSCMPAAMCMMGAILSACAVTGPNALRNGRLAYNMAITDTNNQQMLATILRSRYYENSNLLAVTNVTANVSLTTRADVQFGIGSQENYSGNLVPLSASAIYEENPTISYVPVAGSEYAGQVAAPIPIAALVQVTAIATNPEMLFYALISSVNGIRNPSFLYPGVEPDPRFDQLIQLLVQLIHEERVHWIADPVEGRIDIAILRDSGASNVKVDELLELLGVEAVYSGAGTIILPIYLSLGGAGVDANRKYKPPFLSSGFGRIGRGVLQSGC